MPRETSFFNLWRALVNAEHVRDMPPAIFAFAARQSLVVRMAQGSDQFFTQLPNWLGIDALVDGLVRYA